MLLRPPEQVDVWEVDLRQPPVVLSALREFLTNDELARAGRPPVAAVRRQILVTRAAVRSVLARYAGCAPRELCFGRAPGGKPTLERPRLALDFNVSHSDGLALVAVARGRRVGVDVERVRERARYPAIARRHFTASEAAAVTDIERFFAAWTRKEAYVKALGDGLQRALDSFEVTVAGSAALLDAPGWTLRDVPVPEGYVAALAVEGDASRPSPRRWQPA